MGTNWKSLNGTGTKGEKRGSAGREGQEELEKCAKFRSKTMFLRGWDFGSGSSLDDYKMDHSDEKRVYYCNLTLKKSLLMERGTISRECFREIEVQKCEVALKK